MSKTVRKVTALVCVLVLVLGICPVTTLAAAVTETEQEYGYKFLDSASQKLYNLLKDGISEAEKKIDIPTSLALGTSKTFEVVEMLVADHPEYFWFSGDYQYYVSDEKIVGILPIYEIYGGVVNKQTIQKADTLFQNAVSEILQDLDSQAGTDDYSRAVWLHDKVAAMVTYEFSSNDQTAYGALVDGKGVCAAYARAYQYLLLRAGIPAWTVLGVSYNPGTGSAENHAWNILWINGKCIYVDVTWDDQSFELFHLYFGRTLEEMNADHFPDQTYFASKLPACACDGLGYFEVYRPENNLSEGITAEAVANLLTPEGDGKTWSANLYAEGDSELVEWLHSTNNLKAVIGCKFGRGSYSLRLFYLDGNGVDREYHLKVIDPNGPSGVTISGAVTSYLKNTDPVTVQLIQNGMVAYEVAASDAYTFANVVSGTYTLRAMKRNHCIWEETVTVSSGAINRDVKLSPNGDMNGDGKVNMKDWSRLFDHINKVSPLSGYSLGCADVNRDGKVNMKDWSRLYDHISKVDLLW